jgi:hypothetical protein
MSEYFRMTTYITKVLPLQTMLKKRVLQKKYLEIKCQKIF